VCWPEEEGDTDITRTGPVRRPYAAV